MDRLQKLGIKSLEYRILEFDLILMYKIRHNLSDLQLTHILLFIKLIIIYDATVLLFSHYYVMLSMMHTNISFLIVL